MRPEHRLYSIALRLRSLFRWAQVDKELDDELRDHLGRKTEDPNGGSVGRLEINLAANGCHVSRKRNELAARGLQKMRSGITNHPATTLRIGRHNGSPPMWPRVFFVISCLTGIARE